METLNVKIIKCSHPDDWYADMIGKTIEVKRYLTTLGAETLDGKILNFYDLEIQWKSA